MKRIITEFGIGFAIGIVVMAFATLFVIGIL